MLIAEILALDKTQASIKKIDLFLANLSKTSKDYLIALSYKAKILNKIGKPNEALKLMFTLVPNFKYYDMDANIAICDAIIEICIDVKRFDQVAKYIELKNKYLPVSKKSIYTYDLFRYYQAVGDRDRTKEILVKYLNEATTKEERILAEKELSKIYYSTQAYDKYLEFSDELEEYYQANLALDELNELLLNKLTIAFIRGNYNKVIVDGNVIIKESIPNKLKIEIATLLIKSYLACNDYKRASITESNYEENLSVEYAKESYEFCKASYELYTRTKTIVSIREYERKLEEYEEATKQVKKEKKTRKKAIEVEIPNIEIEEEPEEEIQERLLYEEEESSIEDTPRIEPVVAKISNVKVSEGFSNLSKIFKLINEISLTAKFREIYRLICIEICNSFPIDEIYFLYFRREFLGIHYKKERAYDKKPSIDLLEGTLGYKSMIDSEELFFDSGDTAFNKSIVTGLEFEGECHLYSSPLSDDIDSIGSVTFKSSTPFLNTEMTYESLKLIISALNSRFVLHENQRRIEYDNQKLFFIINNMSSGIKDLTDNYIHLNDTAVKTLDVISDMTLDDYCMKMKSNELGEYKRILEELTTLMTMDLEYEYDFKRKDGYMRVKERFYPFIIDGVLHIYSLIDDITLIRDTNEALLNLAYCNPVSKLNTELKLSVDLTDNYPNKKLALAILEANELELYKELYGFNFKKQLILAIGEALKEAIADDFLFEVYHLDSQNYAILLNDINDKRAVDIKLKRIFTYVADKLYNINSRVKLTFSAGVYRLGKNTNLDNPAVMITYAYNALDLTKELDNGENHIVHYDGELDKQRHYNNSLVTHISEAIDHGKLGLVYQQIADIEKNQVFGYYIKLNLDNMELDDDIFKSVVEKKGLTKQLEQYTIINTLKEQRMFYDKSKSYLLCFVSITGNYLDEAFFRLVEQQRALFKIKPSSIVLDCTSSNVRLVKGLREMGYLVSSSSIMDVISNSCDFYFYNYHTNTSDVTEIKDLCSKHNTTIILSGIDEKNDIDYAKASSSNLVYGKFYKKSLRIKSILEKMNK